MNHTTKLTYELTNTQSTQSTYFKFKDLSKSQATNRKKIVRMQVRYADAYAKAVSDIALYLPNAWNGILSQYYTDFVYSDKSTTRQKASIINYSFYKCIVTLLGFSKIPKNYATAFYLANIDQINSLMVDELNQLLTENN